MPDRMLEHETINVEGRTLSALRIVCAKCEGKALMVQHKGVHLPPEAGNRYFSSKGWKIGSTKKGDLCPACQKSQKPKLEIVKTMQPATAEKPREMTRDERRIIFQKIDEHYVSEERGYQPPWTDGGVARDLGVPQAWVASVREEMFGPAGSNHDIDEFMRVAEPVLKDGRDLVNAAKSLLADANKIVDRIEDLERRARKIERETSNPAKRRA